MGGSMGGGSGGSTKTDNAPWAGVQPYLSGLYGSAQQQIMNDPTQFYPGQTYANFSQPSQDSLDETTKYAYEQLGQSRNPYSADPGFAQASSYYNDVLSGKYLDSAPSGENPYVGALGQAIGDNVQQQVGARFANSGRNMGSSGETQQFGRDVSNAMAPYLYQDATAKYDRELQQRQFERAAQQNAASGVAGMAATQDQLRAQAESQNAQQGYSALQALQGVGGAYDAQNQKPIDEAMARWQYQQGEPFQRLNQYAQLLGSGSPFTSQTQQASGGSPGLAGRAGGAMGGAASGAAIGSMFGPGYGTAIGAGLGGLMGFFSDRRLKRAIRRVGEWRGLPVYRFKYLWSDVEQVGLMSEDVRAVAPWAVATVGGYDVVMYGLLGQR